MTLNRLKHNNFFRLMWKKIRTEYLINSACHFKQYLPNIEVYTKAHNLNVRLNRLNLLIRKLILNKICSRDTQYLIVKIKRICVYSYHR